jgi:excisionase family DNA binding protein
MPDIDHGPIALEDLNGRSFACPWEVAAILRIDVRTVRRAIATGDIPSVKTGQQQFRIPAAWLRQAALAEQNGRSA